MEKGIFRAICAVMGDMDAIGKDKKNQQQNFMYRGIDDVMNALNPLLVKHGVFVVPQTIEQTREERQTKAGSNLIYSILKIKFTFYAQDGSFVEAITIGEGMDSGDKASNKAMAIAFKYACFQVFCIATEEMKDPDGDTPRPSTPKEPLITPEQLAELKTFEHLKMADIAKYFKVKEIEQITQKQAEQVLTKQRAEKAKKAEQGGGNGETK